VTMVPTIRMNPRVDLARMVRFWMLLAVTAPKAPSSRPVKPAPPAPAPSVASSTVQAMVPVSAPTCATMMMSPSYFLTSTHPDVAFTVAAADTGSRIFTTSAAWPWLESMAPPSRFRFRLLVRNDRSRFLLDEGHLVGGPHLLSEHERQGNFLANRKNLFLVVVKSAQHLDLLGLVLRGRFCLNHVGLLSWRNATAQERGCVLRCERRHCLALWLGDRRRARERERTADTNVHGVDRSDPDDSSLEVGERVYLDLEDPPLSDNDFLPVAEDHGGGGELVRRHGREVEHPTVPDVSFPQAFRAGARQFRAHHEQSRNRRRGDVPTTERRHVRACNVGLELDDAGRSQGSACYRTDASSGGDPSRLPAGAGAFQYCQVGGQANLLREVIGDDALHPGGALQQQLPADFRVGADVLRCKRHLDECLLALGDRARFVRET